MRRRDEIIGGMAFVIGAIGAVVAIILAIPFLILAELLPRRKPEGPPDEIFPSFDEACAIAETFEDIKAMRQQDATIMVPLHEILNRIMVDNVLLRMNLAAPNN